MESLADTETDAEALNAFTAWLIEAESIRYARFFNKLDTSYKLL